jgi:hypothetical protein
LKNGKLIGVENSAENLGSEREHPGGGMGTTHAAFEWHAVVDMGSERARPGGGNGITDAAFEREKSGRISRARYTLRAPIHIEDLGLEDRVVLVGAGGGTERAAKAQGAPLRYLGSLRKQLLMKGVQLRPCPLGYSWKPIQKGNVCCLAQTATIRAALLRIDASWGCMYDPR